MKKAPMKKKTAAGKTRAKAKAKKTAVVKKKAAAKKSAKAPQKKGNNIIWKFLEMKEAKRRQAAEDRQNNRWLEERNRQSHVPNGFGRFAGPRRRAA